jgi:hypothetical protein
LECEHELAKPANLNECVGKVVAEVGEWEARGDLSDPLACEKKVPWVGKVLGWGIENQVRAKIFGDVADDVVDTDVVAALVFFVERGRVDSVVQ